ncbi:DnaJ domain-containing protein [Colletotrichum orchidophilum]|uniref:DnaJ domain-containing protein n=1 Tax=Colletotrichum orchidophilum TaxID=1209926 RepID=A0A1G4BAX0_9PEZI|nr:DnaJ domain-containing protein [Colletotrichum orchidophilum]OHE98569.1 DnaJ domain-containing protein [Colletotrichum orchidophilum]
MGAQQSSGRDQSENSSQPVKTCYYELLGVGRDASDDEIKKSYRKRALELHPDRNLNDVQNATRRFAEVQAAYEVLADPQERAWYDSHREAILRGADPDDSGINNPEYNDVKFTSTEDIFSLIRRFDSTVPFTDGSSGFFGIAKATFDHLVDEEIVAGEYAMEDTPNYPTFGSSFDSYDHTARPFYSSWASFSTRKSFAWKDKYRLADAPDRRIRRAMEKENKKMRDEAIREFNDAVRFLVTFVRKRDPRYLPNTQTAAERQESLRSAAAAQAARSRAANKEKLVEAFVSDWAQARDDGDASGRFTSSEEEESEVEEIECVVCNKTFKSEKSFEAHERSKKHVKAVQNLRRQMKNEDVNLDLRGASAAPEKASPRDESEEEISLHGPVDTDAVRGQDDIPAESAPQNDEVELTDTSSDLAEDDEYASRADVEQRLFAEETTLAGANQGDDMETTAGTVSANLETLSLDGGINHEDGPQLKKMGKAKAKREKRAARQAAEDAEASTHNCSVCNASFPSKTQLFSHIRDLNHAAPIEKASGGAKKKRR